ncbi:hypothetical protein D3C72_1725880 [compost metagenome]
MASLARWASPSDWVRKAPACTKYWKPSEPSEPRDLARSPSGSAACPALGSSLATWVLSAGLSAGLPSVVGVLLSGSTTSGLGGLVSAGGLVFSVTVLGGSGTTTPCAAGAAGAGFLAGFLPYSGEFGSQFWLRSASALSLASPRTLPLLTNGTGTLVT